MPLGLFGSGSASVKAHQFDNRIASIGNGEMKDSKGTVVKLSKHTVVIEKKLAEGGFAVVFLASDKHNRRYALKRQFINADARLLEACKREYRIVSSLVDHKNIVKYVDHLLIKNPNGIYEYSLLTAYYKHSVLQLMNERLNIGRHLSAKEILLIFCDVCEAVARLHHSQTPVVHRDLKVENVLIDDRQRMHPIYVLCDFGSATTKVMSVETHSLQYIEEEINRYTTLSYRAPEMVDLCFSNPIGTKSDIWALGVMLYKLCYFTLPFAENALAIQNCTYTFPVDPKYPDELRAIITMLLEVDINRRPDIYQTASLAFETAGLLSPIQNLNKVRELRLSEALQNLKKNQDHSLKSNETMDNNGKHLQTARLYNKKVADPNVKQVISDSVQNVITSVNPRLRPKPLSTINTLDLTKPSGLPPMPKEILSPIANLSIPSIVPHRQNSLSNPDTGPLFNPDEKHENREMRKLELEHALSYPTASENYHTSAPQLFDDKAKVSGKDESKSTLEKWTSLMEKPKSSAFKPYSADKEDSHSDRQSSSAGISRRNEFHFGAFDDLTWNPFLDAPFDLPKNLSVSLKPNSIDISSNTSMDDGSFGKCFDKLPRVCRARTSRDLDSPEIDESDPFGAAPFDPKILDRLRDKNLVSVNSLNRIDAEFDDANTSESASEKEIHYESSDKECRRTFNYEHLGERINENSTGSHDMLESSMSDEDDDKIDHNWSSSGHGIFSMVSEGITVQPLLDDDELEGENHIIDEDDAFCLPVIQPSTPLASSLTQEENIKNWFTDEAQFSDDRHSRIIRFGNCSTPVSTNPFSDLSEGPSICLDNTHRSDSLIPFFPVDSMRITNSMNSTGCAIKSPQSAPPMTGVRNSLRDVNIFQLNFVSEEIVSTLEDKKDAMNRKTRSVSSSSDEYPQTDDSAAEMFSGSELFNRAKSTFSPRACRRRKVESMGHFSHRENISKSADQAINASSKSSPIFKKSVKPNRRPNVNASFINNSYQAEDWESAPCPPVKI